MKKIGQLWLFLFIQLCALQALQLNAQAQIRVFINDGEFGQTNATVTTNVYRLRIIAANSHIYYTTNGTAPTIASPEFISDTTIFVRHDIQLRILAYDLNYTKSSTRDVNIRIAKPTYLHLTGAVGNMRIKVDETDFGRPNGRFAIIGEGQVVTLTAVDSPPWIFDRWLGNPGSSDRVVTFAMDRSRHFHLSLLRTNPLPLANAVHGQLLTDTSAPYYLDTNLVQFSAIPDPGYFFSGWNRPFNLPTSIKSPSYNRTTEEELLQPNFAPLPEGTVSLDLRIEGKGAFTAPTSFFSILGRTNVVTVQPNFGWVVDHWSGAVSAGATNSVTVVADSNIVLTAHLRDTIKFKSRFNFNATFDPNTPDLLVRTPSLAPNGLKITPAQFGRGYYIVALDTNGISQWTVSAGTLDAPVITRDGHIFSAADAVSPDKGVITAYSQDGMLLWQTNSPGADVAIAVSSTNLYVSSSSRRVQRYTFDASLIREATYGDFEVFRTLALDADSNISSLGGSAVGFTPTLDLRWSRAYSGAFTNLLMMDHEGNSFTSDLKAFKTLGGILWTNAYTNGTLLCVGLDYVYIANNGASGKLTALHRLTGQIAWSESTGAPDVGYAVAAADGSVFAIYPTKLLKISSSGQTLWTRDVYQAQSYPVLDEDGILYYGPQGYDVGVGPAPSGFPMVRADVRHSAMAYVPAPLELGEIAVVINESGVTLTFPSAGGQQLRLESSEDLESWTLVQTFTGPLSYTVPSGSPTAQFYRVVAP